MLNGYSSLTKIYDGRRSVVYQARRDADERPVVLKVLRGPYPPADRVARFKREYEVGKLVAGPRTADVLSLQSLDDTLAIEFADTGSEPLARAIPLALSDFLHVAILAVEALGDVHAHGVIHKDVNPSNIVWNKDTGEVRLIDFGLSTRLSRETLAVKNTSVFEGTLGYISPEQTGRMNRALDYRTDFYSLGATFYELLTGRRPFESTDPMEVIHAHIARLPTPVHVVAPKVPEAVSAILQKLLAKNAEDRYQSVFGLKSDLVEARSRLTATGAIASFPIGQHDVAHELRVPQKLYGRESEVATLMAAFDRVAKGAFELVLVEGFSGIGKTSLVNEIHKPVQARRGAFLSGKFDQFKRNVPYASLIEAFSVFVRQVLTDSNAVIATWKTRILDAVGANGQILADVLPDIGHIIGPQHPLPPLPPNEREARFNYVVRGFVRAIARYDHPLVLFLDDMQWADLPSIRLLEQLATDDETRHLLLVCAARDNELDATHPFVKAVDRIRQSARPTRTVFLRPLDGSNVRDLVADTLRRTPAEVAPLADLCLAKTGGNPFFLNQFLGELAKSELLRLDTKLGRWNWNVAEIEAKGLTDNVVELMVQRLNRLPASARDSLRLAACIGSTFELGTLATVRSISVDAALADLEVSLREGFIDQVDDGENDGTDNPSAAQFAFAHDRIQQAAYSLVDEASRPEVHLTIGRLLLKRSTTAAHDDLFDIVNHLNKGVALIADQPGRDELADLNHRAGARATESSAHQPAFAFYNHALALVPDGWTRRYEATLAIHIETATSAFLNGDYARMNALVDAVLANGRTVLERIPAWEVRVTALNAQNDLLGAIRTGVQALALLDETIPEQPGQGDIIAELIATKTILADKSMETLAALPVMTDPRARAALRLMVNITAAAYYAAPALVPVLGFRTVQVSVRYGIAPESSFGFGVFALVLCTLDDIDTGYAFGHLILRLADRFDEARFKNRTQHIFNTHVRFWKEHFANSLPGERDVYQNGVANGDFEFGAFGGMMWCTMSLHAGMELGGVCTEFERHSAGVRAIKQETAAITIDIMLQSVHCLRDVKPVGDPCLLGGPFYDEARMLPIHQKANDRTNIFVYYCAKAHVALMFRDVALGVASADANLAYLDGGASTVHVPVFFFHATLCYLAACSDGDTDSKHLVQAKAHLAKLKLWAGFGPVSLAHKVALIEAEIARIEGRRADATIAYDAAIDGGRENKFIQDVALANELAGRFHLATSKTVARAYLQEARYTYEQWGATAKVRALEAEFHLARSADSAGPRVSTVATTEDAPTSTLDLDSVWKASQAIASELELAPLVRRIITIAVENAGAQRGFLMLERAGSLTIEARIDGPDSQAVIEDARPLASSPDLCHGIVSYVARTLTPVRLDDAANEGPHTTDPYVQRTRPKSILCAPIVNQGKLRGVLYLENNVSTGAFTEERIKILRMLSAPAAVSIENAVLYSDLEKALQSQIRLNEAHKRFVPHEFLQNLRRESIVDVELGDSVEKNMSILFADVRGFTRLVEGMTPAENIRFINTYLSYMEPAILKNGGFVEGYIGDAIMALFEGSPAGAVAAGVDMLRALEVLNRARVADKLPPLRIGIGISTGLLTLGTIGGSARIKCGVIGDPVNLAARVESITKTYGSSLLISDQTYRALPDSAHSHIRKVDLVQVVGRLAPVTLYEVFAADAPDVLAKKGAMSERYKLAMERYSARDFAGALVMFEACAAMLPDDLVLQTHVKRTRELRDNPPGPEWTGVSSLTHK